jgi:hypothetical protein
VSSGSFYFDASLQWADPGIWVNEGDYLTFTASGVYHIAGSDPGRTPGGTGCSAPPDPPSLNEVAPNLTGSTVVGIVGSSEPFCIGAGTSVIAATSGWLYVSVNDGVFTDNWGDITIHWQITEEK